MVFAFDRFIVAKDFYRYSGTRRSCEKEYGGRLTSKAEGYQIMTYKYPYENADERTKSLVWNKGRPIDGFDQRVWRRDACGYAMKYGDHGNTASDYGWEIDHIIPRSKGGQDVLVNLQPLYWENNRKKGDTYPWYCENAA